ncbi:MAG TPA: efflux RND transporter periplasmic adaptor subunit [Acidobacteriaceae bacterium]|nr:efflux RND transporter periplasmic adaptor subunit [Acidobacteriaceae bacterium]
MPSHIETEMTDPATEYSGTAVTTLHAGAEPRRSVPPGVWIALACVALLLLAAVAYGILSRATAERHLVRETNANAIPTVNVIHPTVRGTTSEIALPGNTQAYNDTPIYARTSGYLKQWFVDIGAHVSKGELMAIIETPEVDEQLQVAQANLKSAEADLGLANTTSARYQSLLKSDSVSKQETDVAIGGAAAKQAAVDAAQANVRRLQQLQSFERVYAPFSGVVTVRNTDIGALIDAGSANGAAPMELFRIASVAELRVFVAVPETYAPAIRNGDIATLTLDEYPGQQFSGKITRNSSAIDPASRTLNVEVDVDNSDGKLLPGAYVFVHFKLPQNIRLLSIPANTLLFRAEGLRVALVRDGRVHLQPITIGKDNGDSLEVATGLSPDDTLILDPSDSIAEGQQVTVSQRPPVTR